MKTISLNRIYLPLSPSTRKVLLNTEIGDCVKLTIKPVLAFLFGELGMNVYKSEVRSCDKLTAKQPIEIPHCVRYDS